MKKVQILGFVLLAGLLSAAPVLAQKKSSKKSTRPKSTASTIAPLDVRTAREKVDIQLSNVNAFLAKLSTLAPDLETAIADQKDGKLKPATSAGVDRAKANLIQSIHDIGGALNTLESDFRTKPALSRYLPSIQGITDLSGQSEDAASSGQFVASKEPLRKIVQKLTDALALMPR